MKKPNCLGNAQLLILVLLLAVLGVVGYIYLNKINKSQTASYFGPASAIMDTINTTNTVSTKDDHKDWITYTDDKAGFSLKYPNTIAFNTSMKGLTTPVIDLGSTKIEDIKETPMGDKDTSMSNMKSLEKGEFGSRAWWSALDSEKVIKIDNKLNARSYVSLAAFEECSVYFDRNLEFFNNGYQVNISVDGVTDQIVSSMLEYFKNGTSLICLHKWSDSDGFLKKLEAHQGKGPAQEWYDLYDEIIKTIKIS